MRNPFQFLATCYLLRRLPAYLAAGDVCLVTSGDMYRIVKVLATDHSTVHVRLYKDRFVTAPAVVDTTRLSLGSIHDPDGFGVGHLPVSRRTFAAWAPHRIQRETVTSDELEGYQIWSESKRGAFCQANKKPPGFPDGLLL
jgi:hypothetical protein